MKLTLKALRINKGLTQEEASNKLNISVESLANYEKGITYPNVPIIKRMEELYEVEYKDILF